MLEFRLRSQRNSARNRRLFLEPLESRSLLAPLTNMGTASDIVFNLPAESNTVILEDDGIVGNGISQLRSTNDTFDTTTFTNPTGSITISGGKLSETLAVAALPDVTASLNLGTSANAFGTISLDGILTLSAGKNLSALAHTLIVTASGTVAVSSGGVIDLTVDNFDLNVAGTLNAGSSVVSVAPLSTGRSMTLGTKSTSELSMNDAEIARITAGTLSVGDSSSGPITFSAVLTLAGKNLTLTTAAGVTGPGSIVNGAATPVTLTIDQAGNSTYSGVLGGPTAGTANDKNLALTKLGAGTLTLTGTNTYTGTTLINSGVLLVNGSVVGNITVNSGATLGGTGTVGKVTTSLITGITVNSGGHLAPGASGPGILRSTFAHLVQGSSFDFLINGTVLGTQYSQQIASAGTSLNNATLNVNLGFTPAVG